MRRVDLAMVQPYRKVENRLGGAEYVPDGAAVEVPCNAYPLDSALAETLGLTRTVTRQVFADEWPFDEFARVTRLQVLVRRRGLLTLNGTWEQTAPAEHFIHTSRPHYTVILKKSG